MRERLPWLVAVAMVLAPAVGLVALAVVTNDVPQELNERAAVVTTAPKPLTTGEGQSATLTANLSGADVAVATGATGIVTDLHVEVGETIVQGALLYAVDGTSISAMVGGTPPYRTLKLGDRGPDVKQVQILLKDLGFLPRGGKTYDEGTKKAVMRLQQRAGAPQDGVFGPDLVVWFPDETFRVATIGPKVGTPAPAPGEQAFVSTGQIGSATLTTADGAPVVLTGPTEFRYGGKVLGTYDADAESLKEAAETLLSQAPMQTLPDPGSGSVGQVGSNDGQDGDKVEFAVTLVQQSTDSASSIPSSAVMTDASGARMCVWEQTDDGTRAQPVSVVGGTLGLTNVTGLTATQVVIVNPIEALDSATCPSS